MGAREQILKREAVLTESQRVRWGQISGGKMVREGLDFLLHHTCGGREDWAPQVFPPPISVSLSLPFPPTSPTTLGEKTTTTHKLF